MGCKAGKCKSCKKDTISISSDLEKFDRIPDNRDVLKLH